MSESFVRYCRPFSSIVLFGASLTLVAERLPAQANPAWPERAVRRDIPMTNAIRKAFEGGTRDSTGRPGRNYWQMRTDYTISARLDAPTSRLTGHETVVLHNNSPDSLGQIMLRLDPNIFLGNTPQAATWIPSEVTDGMVLTKMTVDGVPANTASVEIRGIRSVSPNGPPRTTDPGGPRRR